MIDSEQTKHGPGLWQHLFFMLQWGSTGLTLVSPSLLPPGSSGNQMQCQNSWGCLQAKQTSFSNSTTASQSNWFLFTVKDPLFWPEHCLDPNLDPFHTGSLQFSFSTLRAQGFSTIFSLDLFGVGKAWKTGATGRHVRHMWQLHGRQADATKIDLIRNCITTETTGPNDASFFVKNCLEMNRKLWKRLQKSRTVCWMGAGCNISVSSTGFGQGGDPAVWNSKAKYKKGFHIGDAATKIWRPRQKFVIGLDR